MHVRVHTSPLTRNKNNKLKINTYEKKTNNAFGFAIPCDGDGVGTGLLHDQC